MQISSQHLVVSLTQLRSFTCNVKIVRTVQQDYIHFQHDNALRDLELNQQQFKTNEVTLQKSTIVP